MIRNKDGGFIEETITGSDGCVCSIQGQGRVLRPVTCSPPLSSVCPLLPTPSQQFPCSTHSISTPFCSAVSLGCRVHNGSSTELLPSKAFAWPLTPLFQSPPKQLPPSHCFTLRASRIGVSPSRFILQISFYFPISSPPSMVINWNLFLNNNRSQLLKRFRE